MSEEEEKKQVNFGESIEDEQIDTEIADLRLDPDKLSERSIVNTEQVKAKRNLKIEPKLA